MRPAGPGQRNEFPGLLLHHRETVQCRPLPEFNPGGPRMGGTNRSCPLCAGPAGPGNRCAPGAILPGTGTAPEVPAPDHRIALSSPVRGPQRTGRDSYPMGYVTAGLRMTDLPLLFRPRGDKGSPARPGPGGGKPGLGRTPGGSPGVVTAGNLSLHLGPGPGIFTPRVMVSLLPPTLGGITPGRLRRRGWRGRRPDPPFRLVEETLILFHTPKSPQDQGQEDRGHGGKDFEGKVHGKGGKRFPGWYQRFHHFSYFV